MNNHRIMYLRDSYPIINGLMRPGQAVGCVAIKVNHQNNSAQYNLSIHNPKDQFNREMARSLALGRLTERPITVDLPPNHISYDITVAVMRSIAASGCSNRAVKAAKLWLRLNVVYQPKKSMLRIYRNK